MVLLLLTEAVLLVEELSGITMATLWGLSLQTWEFVQITWQNFGEPFRASALAKIRPQTSNSRVRF